MTMVLSCFDLMTAATNYSATMVYLISWLKEDHDLLFSWKVYLNFLTVFYGYSFYVLLVMSIERYLGAYYPIFRHTLVTRRRLLTLVAILLIVHTIVYLMISINYVMVSWALATMISVVVVFSPLAYFNFKLFKISRKVRRRKATSPEKRTTINLKRISTCLLVVACLAVSSISSGVYVVFDLISENKQASNVRPSYAGPALER